MSRLAGTLNLGSNFEPRLDAPLDARDVIKLKSDLTDAGSFPYFYLGMTVFVEEELKKYTLIGNDPTDIANWKVESAGGAGGSTLENGIEAMLDVGGIKKGKTYAAGEELETILRDMLYPLLYPALTDPSVSLSTTSPRVYEVGSTPKVSLRATANLGSINPPYGTSGKRSAGVTGYKIVGLDGSENTTGTWDNIDVSATNNSFTVEATFDVGEQPKDSHGGVFDVAYGGGTKTSSALSFEFVNCVWSNVADITTMAKETAKTSGTKEFTFTFPAQTVANPACFSIPASWTVSKIEVLNEFSGKYEDCAREFTATDATRQDAAGNDVAYKNYTDNRGYNADTRTIKLTIA